MVAATFAALCSLVCSALSAVSQLLKLGQRCRISTCSTAVCLSQFVRLVWTLFLRCLVMCPPGELSARPWHHRASDAYPSFLQAVAGRQTASYTVTS